MNDPNLTEPLPPPVQQKYGQGKEHVSFKNARFARLFTLFMFVGLGWCCVEIVAGLLTLVYPCDTANHFTLELTGVVGAFNICLCLLRLFRTGTTRQEQSKKLVISFLVTCVATTFLAIILLRLPLACVNTSTGAIMTFGFLFRVAAVGIEFIVLCYFCLNKGT